jgi:hypothetical protein
MRVRVTTATPEQVGTLVTERAKAEAGLPGQCAPLRLGKRVPLPDAYGSDRRGRRCTVAKGRGAPSPQDRQRNTRGSTVAPRMNAT